jgi:hypothetical protein
MNPNTRYYFNREYYVVGKLSNRKGEYIHVLTSSGPRVWWDRFVKEITHDEFIRCLTSKAPHNKPRFYIREWKNFERT